MKFQMTLAWRYLTGRKLRTTLTTLAIMFAVLLIVGMNSLLPAFLRAFQLNAMALAGETDATITSKIGEAFPESMVAVIADLDGIENAAGKLERSIGLPADYIDQDPSRPDRVTAVNLVGVDPIEIRKQVSYQIQSGRFLEEGDQEMAVISESLAEEANLQLGDSLRLPVSTGETEFVIVGLLPQSVMPGNEQVLVTLTEAQKVFDMPGRINSIDANFTSLQADERSQIENDIRAALGDSYTIGVLLPGAELLNNIKVGQVALNIIGFLGLLMGGFIILNTFRTIVAERRRDIGMLRAVGASRRTITWLVLTEGMIQGLIGTIGGLVLGYLFAWLGLTALSPIMKSFLNIEINQLAFNPAIVAVAILVGVGITLLAGWFPARAASRITPLEALRPTVGKTTIKRLTGFAFWTGVVLVVLAVLALFTGQAALVSLGSLLFVVGLLLVSPALVYPIANLFGKLAAMIFARDGTAELAEGNLSRQPGRAAITAATTMIALAILLMAVSILSSIVISFSTMLEKSLSSDYLLVPPSVTAWGLNVGASPELADELRQVDGVEVVSTLRFSGTKFGDLAAGILGINPEEYEQTSGLTFIEGDPETAYAQMESGRNMVINGVLGTGAGIGMGDQVELLTPTGKETYTVVGMASDYINAKTTTAYISQANIAQDFGRTEDVFYQINLNDGADRTTVEAAFKQILNPYPQFKLVFGQEYVDQNLGLLDNMFAGVYAMVIFLAIPSLIAMLNTLAIGVIERRREIGMLRAVGATRRQVRTVVLTEALILAAIGTAFGLLSGLYLGYMTVGALSIFGFPVEYNFPFVGVVVSIAAGLIFGAIAALIPARQAAGMDIVTALRYE